MIPASFVAVIYETLGERLDVIDLDTGMGSLGGVELVLNTEIDLHSGTTEPDTGSTELFGTGDLFEAERISVEDASPILAAGGHGDLDMMETHHRDCRSWMAPVGLAGLVRAGGSLAHP